MEQLLLYNEMSVFYVLLIAELVTTIFVFSANLVFTIQKVNVLMLVLLIISAALECANLAIYMVIVQVALLLDVKHVLKD